MTCLLIRQRCCLCGGGVGTTQLLQLWCHHAAALVVSAECHCLPAASCSQNSGTQATSRANDIAITTRRCVCLTGSNTCHRKVCHSRSSHARQTQKPRKGTRLQVRYLRLIVFNGATFGAGAIAQSLDTKSGVAYS